MVEKDYAVEVSSIVSAESMTEATRIVEEALHGTKRVLVKAVRVDRV